MKNPLAFFLFIALAAIVSCGGSSSIAPEPTPEVEGDNVGDIDGQTIAPTDKFNYVASQAINADLATASNFYIMPVPQTSPNLTVKSSEHDLSTSACRPGDRKPATVAADGDAIVITLSAVTPNGSYYACVDALPLANGEAVTETFSFTVAGGNDPSFTGIPDTVFGSGNGYVSMTISATDLDGANNLRPQIDADGNIYLYYYAYRNAADPEENETGFSYIWKVDVLGNTDTSFGTDGVLLLMSSDYFVEGLKVLDDGSMLALGSTESDQGNMAIWKFTADGVLDTSFGNGGSTVFTNENILYSRAKSAFVDGEGAIYASGNATPIDEAPFAAIWKLTGHGALDTSFGDGDGYIIIPGGDLCANSGEIEVLSNGMLLLSGSTYGWDMVDFLQIWEFDSAGELNQAFGQNGAVDTEIQMEPYSMTVDGDGNIYMNGSMSDEGGAVTVKFGPEGTQSSSFGTVTDVNAIPANGIPIIYDDLFTSSTGLAMTVSSIFGLNSITSALDTAIFTDGYYALENYLFGGLMADTQLRLVAGAVSADFTEARIYRFR
jgi:uncharacterized delta-60 repeat protein